MDAASTYKNFARYYDSYTAAFAEDIPLYLRLCDASTSLSARGAGRILEVGCGTGRVLKPLLEASHEVVGVDISPDMLKLAEEKLADWIAAGKLALLNHDFAAEPLAEKFDRVLVTWYTPNYILRDLAAFLKNLRSSMTDGALLVMDLFYPKSLGKPEIDGVWTEKTLRHEGEDVMLRDQRVFRRDDNIEERVQVYLGGGAETRIETRRRYYPKKEVLALLSAAGFHAVRFTEGYRLDGLRPARMDEETRADYVVVAEA